MALAGNFVGECLSGFFFFFAFICMSLSTVLKMHICTGKIQHMWPRIIGFVHFQLPEQTQKAGTAAV